jgi:hypothetical protein
MAFLIAVLPSLGVLLIFWLAMRSLVQADRRERLAHAKWDAELARAEASHSPAPGGPVETRGQNHGPV